MSVQLPPEILHRLLVSFGVNCLGYGCFLTLTIVTLFTMLRNGAPTSRGQRVLFAAVLLLSIFSTIFCISSLLVYSGWIMKGSTFTTESMKVAAVSDSDVATISGNIVFVLNDAIVVWRAWSVTQHVLRGVLALLLGATIVCVVVDVAILFHKELFSSSFVLVNLPIMVFPARYFILIIYIPLLLTNFISTVIIFHKTWVYRKQVKAYLQSNTRKTQVERVLFLLIESGFIYCALWIIFLCFYTIDVPNFPIILLHIMFSITPYIAAIYPLIIILVVEHQNSSHVSTAESPVQPETSLRFASVPITSCSQESSGQTSISIIQSIADHMELHGDEERSRSEPKDLNE